MFFFFFGFLFFVFIFLSTRLSYEAYASSPNAEKVYASNPLECLGVEGVHLPCTSHFLERLGAFFSHLTLRSASFTPLKKLVVSQYMSSPTVNHWAVVE